MKNARGSFGIYNQITGGIMQREKTITTAGGFPILPWGGMP